MVFVTFANSDIFVRVGTSLVASTGSGVTLNTNNILYLNETGDPGILELIYQNNASGGTNTILVATAAPAVQELLALSNFLLIDGADNFFFNVTEYKVTNRYSIINIDKTDTITASTLRCNGALVYFVSFNNGVSFAMSEAAALEISANTVPVSYAQCVLQIYQEAVTDIYKFFVVNCETGAVSAVQSTLLSNANGWNIDSISYIGQNAGFMPVFDGGVLGYKAFYINNVGEIMGTSDGGAITDVWGSLNYRLMYYITYDTSNITNIKATLKIFDGQNLRVHNFEKLVDVIELGTYNDNITQDLSVLMSVPTLDGYKTYISKNSGALIDITDIVDPNTVVSSAAWNSSVITALIANPGINYTKVQFFSQDGMIVGESNCSTYDLTTVQTIDHYGDGKSYVILSGPINLFVTIYDPTSGLVNSFVFDNTPGYSYDVAARSRELDGQDPTLANNFVLWIYQNDGGSPILDGTDIYDYLNVYWLNDGASAFQNWTADTSGGVIEAVIDSTNLGSFTPVLYHFFHGVDTDVQGGSLLPTGFQSSTTGLAIANIESIESIYATGTKNIQLFTMADTTYEFVIWETALFNTFTITTISNPVAGFAGFDTFVAIDENDYTNSVLLNASQQISPPVVNLGDLLYATNSKRYGNLTGLTDDKILLYITDSSDNITGFYTFDNRGLSGFIPNTVGDDGGFESLDIGPTTFSYAVFNADGGKTGMGEYSLFLYDWETGVLLATVNTDALNYEDKRTYGDRFVWEIAANGTVWYLTRNGVITNTLGADSSFSLNDTNWAD